MDATAWIAGGAGFIGVHLHRGIDAMLLYEVVA
jgi:hypothetical protein